MGQTADTATHLDSVTGYLSWDHDRLDTILEDVVDMVRDDELERAEYAYDDFYQGLTRHIRLEEEVLFPLFERRTGMSGPTQVMRAEHRAIEAAIDAMRAALGSEDEVAFFAALDQLRAVLPDHDLKEERVLYPAIDQFLGEGERIALTTRLARS